MNLTISSNPPKQSTFFLLQNFTKKKNLISKMKLIEGEKEKINDIYMCLGFKV